MNALARLIRETALILLWPVLVIGAAVLVIWAAMNAPLLLVGLVAGATVVYLAMARMLRR